MSEIKKIPTYEEVCEVWANSDHWPLMDAARLIQKQLPTIIATPKLSEKDELNIKLVHEIALNCIGSSLEAFGESASQNEIRVHPIIFLDWAIRHGIEPPEVLYKTVVNRAQELGKTKPPRKFSPKQQHRERCRAIAALLWDKDETLTKAKMAARPEILKFGCEGKSYTVETIQGWIKTENPNRSGGRPKKET